MNFSRLVNPYNHMQKFCQFVYVHIFLGMGSVTKKKKMLLLHRNISVYKGVYSLGNAYSVCILWFCGQIQLVSGTG